MNVVKRGQKKSSFIAAALHLIGGDESVVGRRFIKNRYYRSAAVMECN